MKPTKAQIDAALKEADAIAPPPLESLRVLAEYVREARKPYGPGKTLGGIIGIICIGTISAIAIILLLSGLIASIKLLMEVMG